MVRSTTPGWRRWSRGGRRLAAARTGAWIHPVCCLRFVSDWTQPLDILSANRESVCYYLSKRGAWATQPLEQILNSEFLVWELGVQSYLAGSDSERHLWLACMQTNQCVCVGMYIHVNIYKYIHICVYTCTYIYIYIYIYIRTYIYTAYIVYIISHVYHMYVLWI